MPPLNFPVFTGRLPLSQPSKTNFLSWSEPSLILPQVYKWFFYHVASGLPSLFAWRLSTRRVGLQNQKKTISHRAFDSTVCSCVKNSSAKNAGYTWMSRQEFDLPSAAFRPDISTGPFGSRNGSPLCTLTLNAENHSNMWTPSSSTSEGFIWVNLTVQMFIRFMQRISIPYHPIVYECCREVNQCSIWVIIAEEFELLSCEINLWRLVS